MTDMNGTWLGTYWQGGQPTRFEAVLLQGGNILDGHILDDSHLGEARMHGQLLGTSVAFTKRYLTTSPSPIRYTGTLSTDGNYVHGRWRIGYFDSGTWEAYRTSDNLIADLVLQSAKNSPITASLPYQRQFFGEAPS